MLLIKEHYQRYLNSGEIRWGKHESISKFNCYLTPSNVSTGLLFWHYAFRKIVYKVVSMFSVALINDKLDQMHIFFIKHINVMVVKYSIDYISLVFTFVVIVKLYYKIWQARGQNLHTCRYRRYGLALGQAKSYYFCNIWDTGDMNNDWFVWLRPIE